MTHTLIREQVDLRAAAAAEAERRALAGPTGTGPLHDAIPGAGNETADPALVAAVCQIVGHDIRLQTPAGDPIRVNVARCRSALRRWAIRERNIAAGIR